MVRIVVLGATGRLGGELVRRALDTGHEVTAYVRRPEAVPARRGLTVVGGDLEDLPALTAAFRGADAVVSCLGARPGPAAVRRTDLMQRALPRVLEAARAAGVPRFVLTSALGVGDSAARASLADRFAARTFLRAIFTDKARAEALLPAEGLDWTVVHPVMLTTSPDRAPLAVVPLEGAPRLRGVPKVSIAAVAGVLLEQAGARGGARRLLVTSGPVAGGR
ncbi:NAD(P)-dependent oxidoreductase [Kineococcus gypseus]|uniref:NAD(P)-dependent oxidoreductase n=1 Tax=Kineococcus gypseus TaxID=1637102 RepID=UPI003D7EEF5D